MLVHTVYFYLKPEISESEKAQFVKQVKTLEKIETVRSFYVGIPAATLDRPVIRKDYSVALTVVLDDLEGHDIYQVHQIHKDFIANNNHLWAEVVIYDAN
tara:strand:- start:4938 stop:5237 length:300 start_codon:yes stop_codon:yes gene_type:complete